ncbi:serine dehydratase alpha chain-domain-containing protein [Chytriomyces cf. hyalinus JEL632]|nr:serine dehydratase alpha chain-domain-containing protein [Chytriomyces cf. hyalinus JEL632]
MLVHLTCAASLRASLRATRLSATTASMARASTAARHRYSTFTPPATATVATTASLPQPTSQAAAATVAEDVNHAVVSIFDMFSIGVGPSSSHTVGPMRAAKIFIKETSDCGFTDVIAQIRVDLFGSLALTGVGHGTPGAILMGLEGESPELVDAKTIPSRLETIKTKSVLNVAGSSLIRFDYEKHMVFHYMESLPQHPNGMRITCYDKEGDMIATSEFFSIGGGFVINEPMTVQPKYLLQQKSAPTVAEKMAPTTAVENIFQMHDEKEGAHLTTMLPFNDAKSLLEICETQGMSIADVVFQNELQWRAPEEVKRRTMDIWNVMDQSISNGVSSNDEYLPGKLRVKRRAPVLYGKLMKGFAEYAGMNLTPRINGASSGIISKLAESGNGKRASEFTLAYKDLARVPREMKRHLPALDWVSMYALAVNEENAAGGRVVTAPTNGAAGTIPAVLKYYLEFICPSPEHAERDVLEFLFTAAAVGMLYKRGASISAAEMGCQGEVGVACSMAAAAFTAVMGGTVKQVENAAEIGMEHNLGLTCDPPEGLVMIPCIERNALAAVKAITAAQLALNGDGTHRVTLDQVIATMRQTGMDMMSKYKETSQAGLAVNVPVC